MAGVGRRERKVKEKGRGQRAWDLGRGSGMGSWREEAFDGDRRQTHQETKGLRSRQKFCALCVTRSLLAPLAAPECQNRVQIRTTQHTWAMLSTDDSPSGLVVVGEADSVS